MTAATVFVASAAAAFVVMTVAVASAFSRADAPETSGMTMTSAATAAVYKFTVESLGKLLFSSLTY